VILARCGELDRDRRSLAVAVPETSASLSGCHTDHARLDGRCRTSRDVRSSLMPFSSQSFRQAARKCSCKVFAQALQHDEVADAADAHFLGSDPSPN